MKLYSPKTYGISTNSSEKYTQQKTETERDRQVTGQLCIEMSNTRARSASDDICGI